MNPIVALTAPLNSSYVNTGSNITISANAQAVAPATIASVAFYNGTTLISTATAAPYSATLNNIGTGENVITAVATDSDGNTTTSSAVSITAIPFRTDFTEFENTTVFPDSTVNYWFNVAGLMLNPARWMSMLITGLELFVAHNVVLEAYANQTVAVGGLPGLSKGAISGESVDKGSVSYDTASTLELDAGHWNLTVYGTRFIRMAKMFGAGPIQIGIGFNPNPLSGGAWPGPDCFPGFTNFGN